MSDYRELTVRLIRDNWAAEAANLSLRHHDVVCPLRLAPTIKDRAALATYWAEECRHALWFATLLNGLGVDPPPEQYEGERPGELLRLPIASWLEFGLFQLFADWAGVVHLGDYETSSYEPLRRLAARVLQDERKHVRLATANLRRALGETGAVETANRILPTWYAAAVGMFGRRDRPSGRDRAMIEAGLRRSSNVELRETYRVNVRESLRRLGLSVPEDDAASVA